MMAKTKLALAALLLLQIVPAADAASKKHQHHEGGAYSAYDYAGGGDSNYNFARQVYGWDGGLYPFNIAPDGRPNPLTSGGKCWLPSQWGPPEWAPCP
jgi:hypothetical protein